MNTSMKRRVTRGFIYGPIPVGMGAGIRNYVDTHSALHAIEHGGLEAGVVAAVVLPVGVALSKFLDKRDPKKLQRQQ